MMLGAVRRVSSKGRRHISELSWASQFLEKNGEKLEPVKKMPPTITFSTELFLRPTPYVKNLADRALELNAVEAHHLTECMRIRMGLSEEDFHGESPVGGTKKKSSAAGGAAEETKAAPEPVKEKEFFDVKLGAVDAKSKIKIIKEIRTITNLGLKEAKELVEKAPVVVKQGLKKEEAEKIKKILVDNGAEVELL